jgi:hypothetical protein
MPTPLTSLSTPPASTRGINNNSSSSNNNSSNHSSGNGTSSLSSLFSLKTCTSSYFCLFLVFLLLFISIYGFYSQIQFYLASANMSNGSTSSSSHTNSNIMMGDGLSNSQIDLNLITDNVSKGTRPAIKPLHPHKNNAIRLKKLRRFKTAR